MTQRQVLRLELQVAYVKTEAPDEFDPLLLGVYLDRTFDREVTMLVNPHHTSKGCSSTAAGNTLVGGSAVSIEGSLPMRPNRDIPADAALCFQAYTTTPNKDNVACRQDCGTRTLSISALHTAYLKKEVIAVPMRVHTTREHLIKGMVYVRVHRVTHSVHRSRHSKHYHRVTPYYYGGHGRRHGYGYGYGYGHGHGHGHGGLYGGGHGDGGHGYRHFGDEVGGDITTLTPYNNVRWEAVGEATDTTIDADVGGEEIAVAFGPIESYMNRIENIDHLGDEMMLYKSAFQMENKHYKIVHSGTQNILCPFDPSEVTAANTQLAMPLAAYMLYEPLRVEAGWWQNQWAIMAGRHGFRGVTAPVKYSAWLVKQPIGVRASAAMSLCTQYIELMPYVSDRTAGKPVEMFGDILAMISGDCEDGANGIAQMRDALRAAPMGFMSQPVQRNLQTLSRQYVDIMCIDGVTASHVSASKSGADMPEVTAAHAAVHALPRDYFGQCVGNWDASHPLARYTCAKEYVGKLPVLVGEGTGVLDAGITADPCGNVRSHLYSHRTLAHVKKEIYGTPGGESDFYKVMLFGTTNTAAGMRIGTFRFARRDATGGYTSGVHYVDLMRRDPTICLVPYNNDAEVQSLIQKHVSAEAAAHHSQLDTEVQIAQDLYTDPARVCRGEFTGEQYRIMQSVVKTRIPPPPLVAAVGEAVGGSQMREQALARATAWCARANTSLGYNVETAVRSPMVNIYPYPSQVTDQFMQALVSDVQGLTPGSALGMSCALEEHHAQLSVVRISVHCRPGM